MSTTVQLEQDLHAGTSAIVEIPDIDSWDDIVSATTGELKEVVRSNTYLDPAGKSR